MMPQIDAVFGNTLDILDEIRGCLGWLLARSFAPRFL